VPAEPTTMTLFMLCRLQGQLTMLNKATLQVLTIVADGGESDVLESMVRRQAENKLHKSVAHVLVTVVALDAQKRKMAGLKRELSWDFLDKKRRRGH
jgi:hypothetical protein